MSLVVKSKIRDAARVDGEQLSVTADFADALEEAVKELIEKAARRAKSNKRNTIMPRDL